MTFDAWLEEAVGSFPAGVRARLAQEYRAHWEESGGGDAAALFGKPGVVRRRLKWVYLSSSELRPLQELNGGFHWFFTVVLCVVAVMFGVAKPGLPMFACIAAAVLAWTAFWVIPRDWAPVRRDQFRLLGNSVLVNLLQLPVGDAGRGLRYAQIGSAVAAVMLVVTIALIFMMDARLRRTLALEGASA